MPLLLVKQLVQEFGPDMSELESVATWAAGRIPPHPPRYNDFGVLDPLYFYQVETGPFVPTPDRPVCRRGGRVMTSDDIADERFQRPTWDWDRAHLNADTNTFDAGYYPEFDAAAAARVHPGLCSLDTQYDVSALRVFSVAFPTYRYHDGYDAAIECARGFALRYVGPYESSEGRHERGYEGARAAADKVSIMKEVGKGYIIGPLRVQPFPVMKLNGRLGVPKTPTSLRWCLNSSVPFGNSVNTYSAAMYQVFVPCSSTKRVGGRIAACKAAWGSTRQVKGGAMDFDDAYKSICIALRDQWLCVFRIWSVEENIWHYFVVKRMNFGVVGSGFSFGRIAVLVVWVLAVLGLGPELWVDDILHIGTSKQITCGQRAASIMAQMMGFNWKVAKTVGPSDCVRWVGWDWDIPAHQMRATPEFLAKIVSFIDCTQWPTRAVQRRSKLESLLGLLGRAALAVRNGLLHCFHLRVALRRAAADWAMISQDARDEVAWWRNIAARWNGVCTLPMPIADRPTEPAGRSDSCGLAMGGIWFNPRAREYRYFFHQWESERAATLDMCAKECLGAATLIMLCARDLNVKQMALPAFMVETDSMVTVQCWERRSAGRSAGVAHALLAVDEATTLYDVSTYTYLNHIPGVKNPLADAVSRAHWETVRDLTSPYHCVRVKIPASWQMRWL